MHRLIGTLVLSLLTCTGVFAQATAEISGTVKDQTGAVLPGAEIKATQTDTGIERTTISNETGSYVLPNLALGPYRVEVSLPGFRTFVQTGVVLQVNSRPVVNAVLEVGQVSEQVEVQANAAMVETRSVGVGQVMENARILELPLNGRQAAELITLSGAAVAIATTGNRSFAGTPVISAAGGLGYGAAYSLDGIFHMDPYDGQSQPLPFPDALQEFKVESSGLSAQNGRASSVNAVTKSGTNSFHGDLFEFVRNDLFNATNYFAAVDPVTGEKVHNTLKRNQFGGTIGGAIVKNRLFFFGGYQGTTIRQDPANLKQYVPTAAMLAGDWTAFASPACNAGRQLTLGAPFVGNRVDSSLFSRAALNIAAKLPKTSDPCGLITFGQITKENDGQYVGKVDFQRNAKDSMFGRYVATLANTKHPYDIDSSNILNTSGKGFDNIAQAYTFGDTYLIGSNIVNAYRLSVSRVNVQRTAASFFAPRDVGINVYNYVPNYMTLGVTGGFSIGGGTSTPSTFRTTFYQTADDVSLVRGTHQLGFGGRLATGRSNTNAPQDNSFSFNGQALGSGLADYMLGRPSGFTQRDTNVLYVRQWFAAAYAQDTWKATPKVTLNYGVRWQPFLKQEITNGNGVYSFDYDRFTQGIKSSVFKNAPAGFYYPGDPGFPSGKSGFNSRLAEFSPRVGLAWDVQGDGRTSVRASYGMSYEDLPMQWRIFPIQSPPWGNVISLTSPAGGLENPWSTYPGGNPFPTKFGADVPFVAFGDFQSLDYNIKPITVSSWNLSLQRQVASDWLASASYLGTQTLHVWTEAAANSAIYIPGNCQAGQFGLTQAGACSTTQNTNFRRRLYIEKPSVGQFIGNLGQFDNGGSQIYHGMLLSLQRRATRGVIVSGNYTWSHCLGDEQRNNQGQGFGPTETYIDPLNRRSNRGNCSADRRHIFNMTAVGETPSFSGKTLHMLASGWRLSGIFRKSTGAYLNITGGIDRALTGIASQRPLQVLENPYGDKSVKFFLNPAAFQQPALGTYGNVGYASVEGPRSWSLDTAVSRVFKVRENQTVEFRAEAYNLTNSLRMLAPPTALNNATFGQVNSAMDPRILQFALKYVF
jgi:Carboxypeptidase regulatory-like domain/TonB dependent receptor